MNHYQVLTMSVLALAVCVFTIAWSQSLLYLLLQLQHCFVHKLLLGLTKVHDHLLSSGPDHLELDHFLLSCVVFVSSRCCSFHLFLSAFNGRCSDKAA